MRAFKSSLSIESVQVLDRAAFELIGKEWNALVEATGDEPFYRHEYLRTWSDHFAPRAAIKVLTGYDDMGMLVAALPLIPERGFMYGIPVRRLVSPTNVHSFRFDLLALNRESAARAFFDHLATDDSWDVIQITDVPEGGNAWQIYEEALQAGFPAGSWESQRSPYIPLPLPELSSKFRSNLRRRRRRLEEQGTVSVECITGGSQLQVRLNEMFAIEANGWKGRKRTAIGQDRSARNFFTELAHLTADQGVLSLYFLKINGKAVASQYGLTRGGVYSLLMTSFDEAAREYSPGHLLLEDVLKDCAAQGVHEIDFLGCDLAWKLDWTKLVRFHHWLFIFRNDRLGHGLQKAKFQWIPAARQRLGITKC